MLLNTLLTAIVVGVASGAAPGFLQLDFTVDRTANATRFKRSSPQSNIDYGGYYYYVDVFVGSQRQRNNVILDTGSSDLWVLDPSLASQADGHGWFNSSESTTYKDLKIPFNVAYGFSGAQNAQGHWSKDKVALSPDGPSIDLQFGVATEYTSLGGGFLGLGPIDQESLDQSAGNRNYPNLPEALKQQGIIKKNAFSLYLKSGHDAGTVLFGAIDHAKYSGELKSVPVIGDFGYNVQVESFEFEGTNHDLKFVALVDSGSPSIYLPQEALDIIVKKVFPNGHKTDQGGIFYIDGACPQADDVKINLNGISIAVPSSNYLQANASGPNTCTLAISTASEYLLGDPFLKSAYAVYSNDDNTVSFAPIKHTTETDIRPIV